MVMKMKKIIIPLTFVLFISVIIGYALRKDWVPNKNERAYENTAMGRRLEVSGAQLPEPNRGKASKYMELRDKYWRGVLSGDPVSIDNFMRLEGACDSGVSFVSGAEAPVEVKRLKKFCAMHYSERGEVEYRLNVLQKQSYSAKIEVKFRELEAAAGRAAARRELSAELRGAGADQAQIILEYASNAGLVPEELDPMGDIRADPSLAKKLSILSHIEFCRRGGDCAGSGLPALAACVSLPPCPSSLGLLEVIRRASAPRDYEAAQAMSEMLHRRR